MQLTAQIGLKEGDMLISVGDIIDRGGKSKEVYHYFRNRPNSVALYPVIMDALAAFVAQLVSAHGADFSKVANQYAFKTYLFKIKGNNLKIEDMGKGLNTPAKVIALAKVLGLTNIPERNN